MLKDYRVRVDTRRVTDEHSSSALEVVQKGFSIVRKGYDPGEVDQVLAEYEHAFRDLEEYASRLKQELNEARIEMARLQEAEEAAIDNAMLAVFDAKDRIIKEAVEKARLIEEEAREAAGLAPAAAPVETRAEDQVPVIEDIGAGLLDELKEVVADDADGAIEPNDVLAQMLLEADQIRDRLDAGLSAAFDQMEQMQQDAEARARELLASARLEAAKLREDDGGQNPPIAVTIDDSGSDRPSRYSKQSAGLPRIGADDGGSVLAAMANLRARIRDGGEEQDPVPTSDPSS